MVLLTPFLERNFQEYRNAPCLNAKHRPGEEVHEKVVRSGTDTEKVRHPAVLFPQMWKQMLSPKN